MVRWRHRDADERAQSRRPEARIRSTALVSDDAVFPDKENADPADGQDRGGRPAFSEDELRTAYDEATRRATEWYRSSLCGSQTAPDRTRTE